MRILTENEIDQVSGGWMSAFMWGAGAGVAGNYLYDAMGGFSGVNTTLNQIWDSFIDASLTPIHYSS